ncbi:MAG: polymerase subunit alpha [Candidatus Sumerlaeota bacterium]|nr:polymerase subunit alpha [Candidatus Sumerlaeota bacterium]
MAFAPADFVHLHVHSEYSLLDGANRIKPMLNYVKGTLGQSAVALTDHGVLFGALEFYAAAHKVGVKPIMGCEVYITPKSRKDRGAGEQKNTHHLLLLAENYEGYRNLCKLSSAGFIEGFYYKPRIDFETLEAHSSGLIATSSCLSGLIPRALLDENMGRADALTGRFIDIFGRERFFMELQDHGLKEQRLVNAGTLDLAKRHNLKLIATNDAHYMTRDDAEMHEVLLCVQTASRLSDPGRMKFDSSEFYMKSTEEMANLFRDLPDSISNTRLVAEMCNVEMPPRQYRLPRFPCPDGKTEMEYLREKVWEGVRMRYGSRADTDNLVKERTEFELATIEKMKFPAYFLIVADFIEHARSVGIPVGPGRGSAAGSVVAYALRITELCPLEHGLLFERFLNPDRLSMPDIDIDFCFERRGEVIEYVRRKYGEDCVSQIITFGTMKAKAAVRDVGRVLDIPLDVVNKVAKSIPADLKMTIPKALEESAELRELSETDPAIKRLLDMATRIEGMVRHASTHAAGIIIADRPLTEYCPLYKAPSEDRPATQFTMTECEESLGLLKMDFLGIKNLTIIQRVTDWLRERQGIEIDWNTIPTDDPKTYEELQKGHTPGVFQLESEGMTTLVRRLKPTEFSDLTALLALYRPGPLGAGMHDMYVRRKHGEEAVRFDHPILEPILGETYGVILYQEQVMRISMAMSGFTRGEADKLRKAMGKKKVEEMAKMKTKWVGNAPAHSGVPSDLAEKIWNDVVSFASYGFNKSHSAAYAVVTFRTAYLRAHYRTYFLAALLTNEIAGTVEAIAKYVAHCREVGIEVLPPDINRSREYFNPEGDAIWYALNGLKGVGTTFARAVVRERDANGPFQSLQDFCVRMPREEINSRMVEALIKAGAFDALHKNRAAMLAALPEIMSLASEIHRAADSGQDDLFDMEATGATPLVQTIRLPALPPWDSKQQSEYEKEILGFFLTNHPLRRFEVEMRSFGDLTASAIEERAAAIKGNERVPVRVVGYITGLMPKTDKNGNPWAIVQLEDLTGSFDVKFFSRSYEKQREKLRLDTVVQIQGTLSVWNDRASIDGNVVIPAEELRNEARGVVLEWDAAALSSQALFELSETCRKFGGSRPVVIVISAAENVKAHFSPNGQTRINPTPPAIEALRELPGRPKVSFLTR